MHTYFEILKKCPLFCEITREELFRLLNCLGAKIKFFDKKYTIMHEGEPAKYIGIVLSGSVNIVRIDYYGNRSILENADPSETFGESFACAGAKSLSVSVIANEPSEIMLIDCNRILHSCPNHCGFHEKLIFNLMKNIAEKSILFHRKLEILSKRTTEEKLLTYLMFQAQKAGSNSFDIPFDRQELADYLEVDRSGLSSEISKLRKKGILVSRKNHFELLKRQ